MSDASLAGVVAQLSDVRRRLATAAVDVTRARAEISQADSRYAEAAGDSRHPGIRQALAHVRWASANALTIARFLEQARHHFTCYLERIVPGAAQDDASVGLPDGELLLVQVRERSDLRSGMDAFIGRTFRNIENYQDSGRSTGEITGNTIRIVRAPRRPNGGKYIGTASPAVVPTPHHIDVPEAAGHLVVLGLLVGIAAQRLSHVTRREIARFRRRGHQKRTD
mgnify:CR=1 FL=1